MSLIWSDLRHAGRLLRKRPGFAVLAVLTLALGIGANTAIFSIVHGVLIAPLPYPDPTALVKIAGVDLRENGRSVGNLSVPDFFDFARQARTFAALGAHNYGGTSTITGGGRAERIERLLVSSGYFRVLNAVPMLGRTFLAEEDRPAPPDVTVISYGLWKRRFGGANDVVGRTLEIGGRPFTIVGVMPAGFEHPYAAIDAQPELFMLLDPDERESSRSGRYIRAIGRLNPGVTIERASEELGLIASRLEAQYPASNTGRSVVLTPLSEAIVGSARRALLMLLAAVGCVLLIACVNVANLLLAESLTRRRELTIRAAIGASRRRLLIQLLTESAVLTTAGAGGGLVLASSSLSALIRLAGPALPRAQVVAIDPAVLGYTIAISIVTAIVFGVAPAFVATNVDLTSGLKDGGRTGSSGSRRRGRTLLVAAEVALSVVLLAGAALLVKSLDRLLHVDPGFAIDRLLTANVAVPLSRYPEGTQIDVYARLYDRLHAIAGVRTVGAINILPLSGNYSCDGIQIDNHPVPEALAPCAEARSVNTEYFDALSIPLVRGRLFDRRDTPASAHVVIVNEAFAARFWPGQDPIGHHLTYTSRRQGDAREVVGVVGNVRHFDLSTAGEPEFYTPQTQPPSYHTMTLAIRADQAIEPASIASAVRQELTAIDPEIPLYGVSTMSERVGQSVAAPRFRTVVLALFAGLALLLALTGVYGVAARATAQRTQEIGVRVALGARGADIVTLLMRQGIAPVVAGVAAGVAGAFVVNRALSALLFEVRATDAVPYVAASIVVLTAACAATAIPARRATRIDPLAALKVE
jgi:putative ABC transport system permease protein